jgi:retron-type reverse transcriptase
MSFCPARRGGNGVAGARARLGPADPHRGTRRDFLRRHETEATAAARGTPAAKKAFVARLLPRAADSRNLRRAWDYLAAEGGQAPGLDGLRSDDLEEHEVWRLVRTVGEVILDDTYRPGPDRKVAIPKSGGAGTRTLSIPSLVDRLVQRAVVQVTQPYLDHFLGDGCLGYRPGVDINKAIAKAEQLAVEGGRWAWLAEDLKDAFDNVPQRRLLDALRTLIPDGGVMRLLGRLVKTGGGIGIRQGGPLSPLLLNVYLGHFLDRKWHRLFPGVPLLRWADDVLVLCRDRQEALQAYQGLKQLLLPAGMRLKGTPEKAVHDLKGGAEAIWLGYLLRKGEGGLKVLLTERSWKRLEEKLGLAHTKDFSSQRAVETILGWVGQMGPCLPTTDVDRAYARVASLARDLAFDELPSKEEVTRSWRQAYLRWGRCREQLGKGLGERAGGSAYRNCETGGARRPAGAP